MKRREWVYIARAMCRHGIRPNGFCVCGEYVGFGTDERILTHIALVSFKAGRLYEREEGD